MAWEASFSKILTRPQCRAPLPAARAWRQEAMRVLSIPASHATWRFFSDFTRPWMWLATEHWTSRDSCEEPGR